MKLLLAEDEVELSNALIAILQHNHYTVDAVYDGQAAIEYLSVEEYDGVILDIMMPKKDGIEVIKELRESGNNVPVLFLTAKSEIDDRVLGLDLGADDYLTKPFAMKELLARIRSITRRKTENASTVLTYGNTSLEQTTAALSANGSDTSIRLTNKEFQMMEMFLSAPETIISVDRLFERIWGYESDTETNVVWVNISTLRKKLTSLGADICIKAMRNQGYILTKK